MRCGQSSDPWKPPESVAPMGDSTLSVAGQHEHIPFVVKPRYVLLS